MQEQVKIRQSLGPKDIAFVYNSWLKSYRDANAVKTVPNDIYYSNHHAVITSLLRRPNAKLLIACNSADEDQIFGYVVAELINGINVIHWVYVKFPFRKFGIARSLVASCVKDRDTLPMVYTHATAASAKIPRVKTMIFDPYLPFKTE